MKHLRLVAIAVPALLLAACGGGAPPPAPQASATSQPQQASAPAGDATLKPLYGIWALDPANCTGPVLKISKTRFESGAVGCDVGAFTDNGDGTITAAMTCGAAAEKVQMRPIFAPTGEGIDLVYLNRNNLASQVLRCQAK